MVVEVGRSRGTDADRRSFRHSVGRGHDPQRGRGRDRESERLRERDRESGTERERERHREKPREMDVSMEWGRASECLRQSETQGDKLCFQAELQ